MTRQSNATTRSCHRQYSLVPRPNFATWPQLLATWSNERAACTSAIPPCPVINASPALVVLRSPAPIACWPFWARVSTALLQIHQTCASQWPYWKRPYKLKDQVVHAQFPSLIFICCRETHLIAKQCSSQAN